MVLRSHLNLTYYLYIKIGYTSRSSKHLHHWHDLNCMPSHCEFRVVNNELVTEEDDMTIQQCWITMGSESAAAHWLQKLQKATTDEKIIDHIIHNNLWYKYFERDRYIHAYKRTILHCILTYHLLCTSALSLDFGPQLKEPTWRTKTTRSPCLWMTNLHCLHVAIQIQQGASTIFQLLASFSTFRLNIWGIYTGTTPNKFYQLYQLVAVY